MKNSTLLFLFLTLAIGACKQSTSVEGTKQVVILHTNDMHAKIDNMAKLSAYKKAVEAEYKNVLLVSAGDIFSGNPYVDYHEDKGYPMIQLMNQVGYNVSALGNHEFDYGQEILAKRIAQAKFPILCANIQVNNGAIPQPKASHVIKIDGLSIYFAALLETGNDGLPSTHPDKVIGIEFPHAFTVLDKLKAEAGKHNAYIALSHLGVKDDLKMTSQTDLFDVVIGGHSHTLLNNAIDTNHVLVVQAGDYMKYVGKLILTFQDGELQSTSYEMVNLSTYDKTDEVLAAEIEQYNENPFLKEPIAFAKTDIVGKRELGALFTDAQVNMQELDFCFQNNGGLRISKIPAGEISVATIYSLDPFGNSLLRFEMTPKEIEGLVKASFDRSPEINFQVGGGTYTIFTDEFNNWKGFEFYDATGILLNTDSTYAVGLNSYIARSYTFDHADEGTDLSITTAENMINYLKQVKEVDYAGVQRQAIKVVKE